MPDLTDEEKRLIQLLRAHPENITFALRALKQEAPADGRLRRLDETTPE